MNRTGLVKYAGALAALAIFSACGGGSAVAPSTPAFKIGHIGRVVTVNGRMVTAAHPYLSATPRFDTLAPDVLPGRKHEYIINDYGTYAAVFDYPTSTQQIGEISNVGGQGCTHVLYGYGTHTFWIMAGNTQMTEYGTRDDKAIKTLSTSAGQPSSCAMDSSGDLAVGILSNGDIVIYPNATGSGTVMSTPLDAEYFDGYDNNGNLFADGFGKSNGEFTLIELPKGSTTFKTIATSNTVLFPGSVQWDGTYLTVVDQEAASMYQYTVSGTTAELKGTVSLAGSSDCAQTWIAKRVLYCADAGNSDGEVYDYPAGGSYIAVLGSNLPLPLGTVAAKK